MASNALTVRSDTASSSLVTHRGWENADFPIVCERCLGDNPYIRMQVDKFGGTCKMCDRPFSVFKWRPGRGEGYKKTEVCQACARIKNLCQTCILDMQLGLPAQLRDAVLQHSEGVLSAESQKNKDYMVQQQLALLDDSGDMLGELENEKLLQLARSATQNREQPRVKLVQGKIQNSESQNKPQSQKRKAEEIEGNSGQLPPPPPLPPGITDIQSLSTLNMDRLPDNMKSFISQHFGANTNPSSSSANEKPVTNPTSETTGRPSAASKEKKVQKKIKHAPKPPEGPPPESAFVNSK